MRPLTHERPDSRADSDRFHKRLCKYDSICEGASLACKTRQVRFRLRQHCACARMRSVTYAFPARRKSFARRTHSRPTRYASEPADLKSRFGTPKIRFVGSLADPGTHSWPSKEENAVLTERAAWNPQEAHKAKCQHGSSAMNVLIGRRPSAGRSAGADAIAAASLSQGFADDQRGPAFSVAGQVSQSEHFDSTRIAKIRVGRVLLVRRDEAIEPGPFGSANLGSESADTDLACQQDG